MSTEDDKLADSPDTDRIDEIFEEMRVDAGVNYPMIDIVGAKAAIEKLLVGSEQTGRRKEEHYWIDTYAREANALDGFEDNAAKQRANTLKQSHQSRLASLHKQGEKS